MEIFTTPERFDKFKLFLNNCDVEKFFYRIILEHDDKWIESCSMKGLEPYPTNKLKFIFDFLENNIKCKKNDESDDFLHEKKWYFYKFIFIKQYDFKNSIKYKIINVYDNKIILEI